MILKAFSSISINNDIAIIILRTAVLLFLFFLLTSAKVFSEFQIA